MRPDEIILDETVREAKLARQIIEYAGKPVRTIREQDVRKLLSGKLAGAEIRGNSKRKLILTRNPGSFVKPMDCGCGIHDPGRSAGFRLEVFQGCPADCAYCFCQEYLSSDHPVIYVNLEDMRDELSAGSFRPDAVFVTGDIADSLAFGGISIKVHRVMHEMLPEITWELRSKFRLPDAPIDLPPLKFRMDWSLSPQESIRRYEPGTASLKTRLRSIARSIQAGYKTSIRLDPLQPARIDPRQYSGLLSELKEKLGHASPFRFIIGSYKISAALKNRIGRRRYGHDIAMTEWQSCEDGKLRPFRSIRLESYRIIIDSIRENFGDIRVELSMEPVWVWKHLGLK